MGNLIDKVKKGALILAGAATIGLAGCDICGPDPVPEDTTKPVITLMGDNPYNTVIGDPYFEQGYSAEDDRDGDLTGYVQVTSNDDQSDIGNFAVNYNVSDEAGNAADEKTRTINRTVETSELEAMLEGETKVSDGNGGYLSVQELAESEGFYLNRGSNHVIHGGDAPEDDIQGSYLLSGSWVDSNGVSSTYSDVAGGFSNQDNYSIDMLLGSADYTDSIAIGEAEDKVSVLAYDEVNDRVLLSNIDVLSNGDLDVDRMRIPLNGSAATYDWARLSETAVKQ